MLNILKQANRKKMSNIPELQKSKLETNVIRMLNICELKSQRQSSTPFIKDPFNRVMCAVLHK